MKIGKLKPTFDLFQKEIYARIDEGQKVFDMSLEKGIERGVVVGPTRFLTETVDFQCVGYHFKFRKGDQVKLCVQNQGKLEVIKEEALTIKEIEFVEVGVVRFKFIEQNILKKKILDPKLEYFFTMAYNPIFDRMLHKELRSINEFKPKVDLNIKFSLDFVEGLNVGQANAIESIIANQFSGAIQGPPGTGKTQVLSRLVEIALANDLKVGVLSFTNRAVDNAMDRISGLVEEGVVRIGGDYSTSLPESVELAESFKEIGNFKVFAATTHKFLFSRTHPKIDVLIIDEASQIPSYFLPGILKVCSNVVMIGDQHQLPPILQAKNVKGCHPDIFTTYIEQQLDCTMLSTQYRMNLKIQEWSSKRYYEGKLHAHHSNYKRDIFSSTSSPVLGRDIVKYHDKSLGSEKIAEHVIRHIREAKKVADLKWKDIGIISPYRVHASHINRKIQEQLGPKINNKIYADTVDRYQGREKEFIVYTLANESSNSSDFLNDYRRINVAVTRAKSRFCMISDYKKREGEEFSEFLQWCSGESGSLAVKKSKKWRFK